MAKRLDIKTPSPGLHSCSLLLGNPTHIQERDRDPGQVESVDLVNHGDGLLVINWDYRTLLSRKSMAWSFKCRASRAVVW